MVRIGLTIALAALATSTLPAAAQSPVVPAPPYYALPPNEGFGSAAGSPVQQQIQQNYRTQLLQTQREMLQQNPSGVGRQQLDISGRLGAYAAPALSPYVPPPLPGSNPPAGQ